MIPASFEYHRPQSLDEAIGLLASLGDDARVVAGGHSLIPMMKLRLAQPVTAHGEDESKPARRNARGRRSGDRPRPARHHRHL
jgi:FAD binding domain in molybdopterin dehydrogenase